MRRGHRSRCERLRIRLWLLRCHQLLLVLLVWMLLPAADSARECEW